MKHEVNVKVIEYNDRTHFLMQYRDPITRRKKTRSTQVERDGSKAARREAEKAAGKWEAELREGRYRAPINMAWSDFRERYENEVLNSLVAATDKKSSAVLNVIEKALNPTRPRDLTTERLAAFQAKLRERGLSEHTIKSYMAHVAAVLNWGKRMGLLATVPTIESPKRAKGSKVMKGRPITLEEFERMLGKVAAVVGDANAARWQHFLRGLWASGLRLGESLALCWDREDTLYIDMAGRRPMLRIPAALEKGNQDRLLPIAPEFAEFLQATPKDQRTGFVFNLASRRYRARLCQGRVSELISDIGEKAGVKVNTDPRTGKVKYASAHDLRRSFGERWASRVMPQVLMELMRHESISTTMRFYVGRNAQATADVLWQAHEAQQARNGNTFGNSSPQEATEAR